MVTGYRVLGNIISEGGLRHSPLSDTPLGKSARMWFVGVKQIGVGFVLFTASLLCELVCNLYNNTQCEV